MEYSRKQGFCQLSGALLRELLSSVTEKGALFRFRAHGSSMYPFVRDGDVLTLSAVEGKQLSIGEIVAFPHPHDSKLAIHRIVGIADGKYRVQGDNLERADGFVLRCEILARVVSVERFGKIRSLGLGIERFIIVCFIRLNLLKLMIKLYCQLTKLTTSISSRSRN